MKYCLLKGYQGFGDRLQFLLYAIEYAKSTNRCLIVDWSDTIWTHDEKDFYSYFNLNKLNFISLAKFKSFFQINSITSNAYKLNLFNCKNVLEGNNQIFYNIINKIQSDFDETVVIIKSVGIRKFKYKLFGEHIKFTPRVLHYIKNKSFYKNIIAKNISYDAIHLRGGDRITDNKICDNGSKNTNLYIELLLIKLNKIDNLSSNLLIVSDTETLFKEFIKIIKKKYNYKLHFSDNFKIQQENHGLGLHKLDRTKTTLSKDELNLEMLADFYFLNSANNVIRDNKSVFGLMAEKVY